MKPAVRQMRGPGMNKGLKKPRHGQFSAPKPTKSSTPKPAGDASSSSKKSYKKGTSYLSKNIF